MPTNKNPQYRDRGFMPQAGSLRKGLLKQGGQASLELRPKTWCIIKGNDAVVNLHSYRECPPCQKSPQLLCSGAVLRYQFKPYLKPDRTQRCPFEAGHVIGTMGCCVYTEGEPSTYQRVWKGVSYV